MSRERAQEVRREIMRSSVTQTAQRIADLEKLAWDMQKLARDMLRWMPCPRPCWRCERYRYPEGCEFARRARKMGLPI